MKSIISCLPSITLHKLNKADKWMSISGVVYQVLYIQQILQIITGLQTYLHLQPKKLNYFLHVWIGFQYPWAIIHMEKISSTLVLVGNLNELLQAYGISNIDL